MTKVRRFIRDYLTHDGVVTGRTDFITRYDLPEPFAYTSGDGIFRNDASLKAKTFILSENAPNLANLSPSVIVELLTSNFAGQPS